MKINNYYDGWIADNICPLCAVTDGIFEIMPDECKTCEVANVIECEATK